MALYYNDYIDYERSRDPTAESPTAVDSSAGWSLLPRYVRPSLEAWAKRSPFTHCSLAILSCTTPPQVERFQSCALSRCSPAS